MPFIQYLTDEKVSYYELPEGKRIVFGRGDDADFLIDNDELVSRNHFAVERDEHGEYDLVDLGARNGTFFNGKRLNRERVPLSDGDTIKASRQTYVFREKIPEKSTQKSVIDLAFMPGPESEKKPESAKDDARDLEELGRLRERFLTEMSKIIVGQKDVIEHLVTALFARGHCLMIGVPGLAKTLIVKVLAGALDLDSNRIQFTPDLMPADITGTDILQEGEGGRREFRFRFGPVFTNVLLADEINRTPPKTQAALLEAMQEQKVTASGVTYKLPDPFMVIATQNPIEQEGTYPLPEAQLDRFMFSVHLGYPSTEEEKSIILETTRDVAWEVDKILNAEAILRYQRLARGVPVSDHVALYASSLARATRPGTPEAPDFINKWVRWGAGPRAGQYLLLAAKTHVILSGGFNVSCADVRRFAPAVLRHRIFRNFAAASEGVSTEKIVSMLLETVKEPDYK